jgi:hypothetical protein
MRSRLIALVLTLVLSGVAGGCTSIASGPVPSPAFGGFRLSIHNTGSAAVLVYVNGMEQAPLDGGETRWMAEWGAPSMGALPWKVEIVDAASGVNVATREITESSGNGAASIEVKSNASGAPTVGDVQSAKGC